MTFLIDTHAFLWFVWNDPKLSSRAHALIVNANNHKLISISSCWEIAIKAGTGKLSLGEPSDTFLPRQIAHNNFDLLPIQLANATAVETLPAHHRDPFDRLLIALVIVEQIAIISADSTFDAYGISRLW